MIGPAPICLECALFHGEPEEPFTPWFCDAFPEGEGIPDEILDSDHDHRQPFDGDGGKTFDPIDPKRVGEISHNPMLLNES